MQKETPQQLFSPLRKLRPIPLEEYAEIETSVKGNLIQPLMTEINVDVLYKMQSESQWIPSPDVMRPLSINPTVEMRRLALYTQLVGENPENFSIIMSTTTDNASISALIFANQEVAQTYSRISDWVLQVQLEPEESITVGLASVYTENERLYAKTVGWMPFWTKENIENNFRSNIGFYRWDEKEHEKEEYYVQVNATKLQYISQGIKSLSSDIATISFSPEDEIIFNKELVRTKYQEVKEYVYVCKQTIKKLLIASDRIPTSEALSNIQPMLSMVQENITAFDQGYGIDALVESSKVSENLSVEDLRDSFKQFANFLTAMQEYPEVFVGVKLKKREEAGSNQAFFCLDPERVREHPELGKNVISLYYYPTIGGSPIVGVTYYTLQLSNNSGQKVIDLGKPVPGWRLGHKIYIGLSYRDVEQFTFILPDGIPAQYINAKARKALVAQVDSVFAQEKQS
ncbi:MAG TPA: hypothetical protein VLF89_09370 [Candidatus Saccharimonadales bacterium]|nr:hypothetical protein [Candidatus Saccharimonadales bacterium]